MRHDKTIQENARPATAIDDKTKQSNLRPHKKVVDKARQDKTI